MSPATILVHPEAAFCGVGRAVVVLLSSRTHAGRRFMVIERLLDHSVIGFANDPFPLRNL
jgi:hypothetical protein